MKSISNPAYLLAAMLAILTVFSGCSVELGERGNGSIISERIETGTFNEAELLGNFRIDLRESDEPSVTVIADENLMEYIRVENNGGRLTISTTQKIRPSEDSKIIINYSSIDLIEVKGAVSLRSDEVYTGEALRLTMSGAGEVDMDVDLGRLELDISGAGAVKLRGNVNEQNISMSGAGGYDARDLISRKCDISISGVGGAKVHVTDQLIASVSGVGGVSYTGNPADVKSHISGLGSISAEDDPS